MRRFSFLTLIFAAVVLGSAATTLAQTGQLRGSVKMAGADGTPAPLAGAVVDVYRTDISGEFHTKSDKKGDWVFAGLPFVGTYVVSVSAPGAAPWTVGGVKAGREIPVNVTLGAGSGKKLTRDEAIAAAKGGGGAAEASGPSASEKEKAEELKRKTAEVEAANKKIENANQIIGEAFKNGNAALTAKNYDEAIKLYDSGISADPDHPGVPSLLTNKASALRSRGVDKYNAAIKSTDGADAKTALTEAAKADFKAAAEASNRAVELFNKQEPATDPAEQKNQVMNKYFALNSRAESMRLFVTKVDPTQAAAGATAYQEYLAAETDPVKKAKGQLDLAQMLLDSGSADKAVVEFQKVLTEKPDDPDANLGIGLALFSSGDKGKYQEAANYLQKFVDKAPDTHRFKNDAKAVLAELKSTENVVPEKTTKPAGRGKRP
jgi:tetratricopeptide (TPR) repeat protein